MQRMKWKKFMNSFIFWTMTYPFGIVIGILFYALKFLKILRIRHWERFPKWQGKIIVASNHPSLWEPILLVPLFFTQYLFSPRKYAPWSTPDKGNYQDKWYWFFVKPRFVPVPRGRIKGELRALAHMVRLLRAGYCMIFFPEGGRTYKGNHFLLSNSGKKIRQLKYGIGDLVVKTHATVVPVWVEGTDKVIPNPGAIIPRLWNTVTIKIGEPLHYDNISGMPFDRKQITGQIADALLRLADEE